MQKSSEQTTDDRVILWRALRMRNRLLAERNVLLNEIRALEFLAEIAERRAAGETTISIARTFGISRQSLWARHKSAQVTAYAR